MNQILLLQLIIKEQKLGIVLDHPRRFKEAGLKRLSNGSGCGSVGRAVASDIRDLRFKSSHW